MALRRSCIITSTVVVVWILFSRDIHGVVDDKSNLFASPYISLLRHPPPGNNNFWSRYDELIFFPFEHQIHTHLINYLAQTRIIEEEIMTGHHFDKNVIKAGPVFTFVKTDPKAHFKWGVRHYICIGQKPVNWI